MSKEALNDLQKLLKGESFPGLLILDLEISEYGENVLTAILDQEIKIHFVVPFIYKFNYDIKRMFVNKIAHRCYYIRKLKRRCEIHNSKMIEYDEGNTLGYLRLHFLINGHTIENLISLRNPVFSTFSPEYLYPMQLTRFIVKTCHRYLDRVKALSENKNFELIKIQNLYGFNKSKSAIITVRTKDYLSTFTILDFLNCNLNKELAIEELDEREPVDLRNYHKLFRSYRKLVKYRDRLNKYNLNNSGFDKRIYRLEKKIKTFKDDTFNPQAIAVLKELELWIIKCKEGNYTGYYTLFKDETSYEPLEELLTEGMTEDYLFKDAKIIPLNGKDITNERNERLKHINFKRPLVQFNQ